MAIIALCVQTAPGHIQQPFACGHGTHTPRGLQTRILPDLQTRMLQKPMKTQQKSSEKNNCDSLKRKDDGFLSDDDEKEEDMKLDKKKPGKKIMKKSWANSKGKVQMTDMNNTLINTASSLSEYLQRRTTRNSKGIPEDDGEESLFCRSLIPRMKQLPKQAKAMFRLQVEQLLFHAEINHQSTTESNHNWLSWCEWLII